MSQLEEKVKQQEAKIKVLEVNIAFLQAGSKYRSALNEKQNICTRVSPD